METSVHFQSNSRISVRELRGDALEISNFGEIMRKNARVVVLRLTHLVEHPDERTYVCMVDGRKNILAKKEFRNEDGRYFELRFDLTASVAAPSNTMRVVRVNRAGQYEVVEVGITRQDHRYFITAQRVYEGFCYQNRGWVVIPRFDDPWVQEHWHANPWPLMSDRIQEMLTELQVRADQLQDISAFVPPVLERPANDNEGVVLYFNNAKCYGAVLTTKGAAYVSHNDIVAPGQVFRKLEAGQRVSFARAVKTEGYAFPLMLQQVRPIC